MTPSTQRRKSRRWRRGRERLGRGFVLAIEEGRERDKLPEPEVWVQVNGSKHENSGKEAEASVGRNLTNEMDVDEAENVMKGGKVNDGAVMGV
ncbi:hypothetical protein VTI28DRAFT_8933 [Corynascus sepedonium]